MGGLISVLGSNASKEWRTKTFLVEVVVGGAGGNLLRRCCGDAVRNCGDDRDDGENGDEDDDDAVWIDFQELVVADLRIVELW